MKNGSQCKQLHEASDPQSNFHQYWCFSATAEKTLLLDKVYLLEPLIVKKPESALYDR